VKGKTGNGRRETKDEKENKGVGWVELAKPNTLFNGIAGIHFVSSQPTLLFSHSMANGKNRLEAKGLSLPRKRNRKQEAEGGRMCDEKWKAYGGSRR
jgi:hypothetical protein